MTRFVTLGKVRTWLRGLWQQCMTCTAAGAILGPNIPDRTVVLTTSNPIFVVTIVAVAPSTALLLARTVAPLAIIPTVISTIVTITATMTVMIVVLRIVKLVAVSAISVRIVVSVLAARVLLLRVPSLSHIPCATVVDPIPIRHGATRDSRTVVEIESLHRSCVSQEKAISTAAPALASVPRGLATVSRSVWHLRERCRQEYSGSRVRLLPNGAATTPGQRRAELLARPQPRTTPTPTTSSARAPRTPRKHRGGRSWTSAGASSPQRIQQDGKTEMRLNESLGTSLSGRINCIQCETETLTRRAS